MTSHSRGLDSAPTRRTHAVRQDLRDTRYSIKIEPSDWRSPTRWKEDEISVAIHIAAIGGVDERESARSLFMALCGKDRVGNYRSEIDPEVADAILFVDLHQQPNDPLLRGLYRHPLVRRFHEKVFVYDERDFPTYTFPGIYVGAPRRWARSLAVVGGPYPTVPNRLSPASVTPDLLFSFRGAATHRVRQDVVKLKHPRAIVEQSDFTLGASSGNQSSALKDAARFRELISRSKFVVCPRGHGPSSFRLYETLYAGRVPVVVSDSWLPPITIPWEQCIVRVRESDAVHIPSILENHESIWPDLSKAAQAVGMSLQEDQLWDHYASSIHYLLRRPRPARPGLSVHARTLHVRARLAMSHVRHVMSRPASAR